MYDTKSRAQLIWEVPALMSADFWGNDCQIVRTKAAAVDPALIHLEPTTARHMLML